MKQEDGFVYAVICLDLQTKIQRIDDIYRSLADAIESCNEWNFYYTSVAMPKKAYVQRHYVH